VESLATTAPVIELRDVGLRRGRKLVVEIDSLGIADGVTAVLGPNGAGKSTLFRALALLDRADHGSIRLAGRSATRDRSALLATVGYLPQAPDFFPGFTVESVVTYAAWLKAVPRAQRAEAVAVAIAAVGLDARRRDRVSTLSGGMRRRLAVAEAIVHSPAIVILDEPTAGLDPRQRAELQQVIRGIGRERCVLVSTHLTDDVAAAADAVVVLLDGRVAFDDTVEVFRARDPRGEGDLAAAYDAVAGDTE
jgi:ABC-2 type transport system ATP-binding protein